MLGVLLVMGLVCAGPTPVRADRVRYHYAPANTCPSSSVLPVGAGQRVSMFGTLLEPYNCPKRATHVVTYRHAFTGQLLSVPISFPEGTPRIEYLTNRIMYNYGSYTVEAVFLPDGSVDVVYDSGLFRPL
jgi:hypothetical protein